MIEKARAFQKNIYFCFIDYTKAFDCVDHNKLRKILKEMGIRSGQLLSRVRLLATPWIAARQASLSITNCWSLPKLMTIQSVMPSIHLILCCPLLLLPSIPPSIRIFPNELTLHMRWPKYWSFSFSISPSKLLEKCKSKTKGDITSHLSEWLSLKSLQITNVGEDGRKGNLVNCWWEY